MTTNKTQNVFPDRESIFYFYREDWPAAKISQRNQYVSVPTWDRMVDDSAYSFGRWCTTYLGYY